MYRSILKGGMTFCGYLQSGPKSGTPVLTLQ